jgi:hypothetical protein
MESSKVKGQRRKAKGLLIACLGSWLLVLGSAQRSQAQTFDEWFAQSKTQIRYLVQQIAALNAFESSVKQGYNKLHSDWWAIKGWKSGEYTLHSDYYNSLSEVNPVVAGFNDKSGLQAEQQSILSQFAGLSGLNGLTAEERTYIGSVLQVVLLDCDRSMADLQNVLTPGVLVLSDDERMNRIAKDDAEIKDLYEFSCHFCAQVRLLAAQRNSEQNEFLNLNRWYEK